jgi:2-polyprenyl-3-methyl-5-hydroxy-6-metoxy-1,4-benzoquinol methylase
MLFDLSRLGAVVSGLELDPKAIELARSLGIEDLRRGTIVDLPVGERFDVIFLNDIVEHLLDPLETLAQSAARLAAGGLLVVEHGYDQAEAVRELLAGAGLRAFESLRDLAGIPRVAAARAP